MNKTILPLFLALALFSGCRKSNDPDQIISMQIVDRNGFSQTISNQDRLTPYQQVNFQVAQPYQKVLRIFGKDPEGKSHSKLTSYHSNGGAWQYLEAIDGRANGRYLEWHENGKLKIEGHIIEGLADLDQTAQKSWLFDQTCTVWDSEGNLEAEFLYDKGHLEGKAKYYHPNGSLEKTMFYTHGILHGPFLVYDEKDNLLEEIYYSNGVKEGAAVGLWAPQVSKYQEQYRNGLLNNAIYFDQEGSGVAEIENGQGTRAIFQDGILHSFNEYKGGLPYGEVKVFHPNQTLHILYSIKEGKKTGEEWEYYPLEGGTPTPKLMLTWFEDKIQGMCKTWYQNGVLESQREMSGNKKHGICFAYYKNGDLMLMEEYENDRILKGSYYKRGEKKPVSTIEKGSGTAVLYAPEGEFQNKITYDRGNVVLD